MKVDVGKNTIEFESKEEVLDLLSAVNAAVFFMGEDGKDFDSLAELDAFADDLQKLSGEEEG